MSGFTQHVSEFILGRHPWDQEFMDKVAARIRKYCASVPTHTYSRQLAEVMLVEATKAAIVSVFQEEFPNPIRRIVVRKDWPYAECWIVEDEAIIKYSWSPETDDLMGGVACEPIRIVIQRAPEGLLARLKRSWFKDRKGEKEIAPTGTPDGQPEMVLSQPIQKPAPAKIPSPTKTVTVPPTKPGPVKREPPKRPADPRKAKQ